MIPLGENKQVFVVNDLPFPSRPDMVACIPAESVKDFFEMYKAINFYANNRRSQDYGIPRDNDEICLTRVNGIWHRAVISKTRGDGKPTVLLIDLFSEQQVPIRDIIPMPKVFASPSMMMEVCRIEGLSARNDSFSSVVQVNQLLTVNEIKSDRDEISTLSLRIDALSENQQNARGL